MNFYTANYSFTNPNFVIQNLKCNPIESKDKALFFILKNIIQRGSPSELAGKNQGNPTILSEFLQGKIGKIHRKEIFKKPLVLIDSTPPVWLKTIKGADNGDNPARDFFYSLPSILGEYAFVQPLILPEEYINNILPFDATFFYNQVDFYLPQAKLIIEIDGYHHEGRIKEKDDLRDKHFESAGIKTIRINTKDFKSKTVVFSEKIEEIKFRLNEFDNILKNYKEGFEKAKNGFSDEEIKEKLIPTAIIRFQMLLLGLLINQYLSIQDKEWNLSIKLHEKYLEGFAELATEDLLIWLENLYQLAATKEKKESKQSPFAKPLINIAYEFKQDYTNIDFSLLKRYTDENVEHSEAIYVRGDYSGKEKNHFKVSTCEPINYYLISDGQDKDTLKFFLRNLFDGKEEFRDGQLPIITNILMRKDTIGLLPTGGGKSLCYQLPSLLQPSITLVICPIKSLIIDQKSKLDGACITNTNYIISEQGQTKEDRVNDKRLKEFSEGKNLFLWVSPERLQIQSFREKLNIINSNFSISNVVIDEVHCLSEWGHDFRTSYLNLTNTIQEFCPKALFIGLTATASINVLKDIKNEFARNGKPLAEENIKSPQDYARKELQFKIEKVTNKQKTILDLTKSLDLGVSNEIASLIFTPHVNGEYGCYEVSNLLNTEIPHKAKWYSGEVPSKAIRESIPTKDIPNEVKIKDILINKLNKYGFSPMVIDSIISKKAYEIKATKNPKWCQIVTKKKEPVLNPETEFPKYKEEVQKSFSESQFPVMVATKAFGMGIDKNDINYTFHYGLPSSVEALYQEAGRAGRWEDKDKKASCYILFTPEEKANEELIREVFNRNTKPNKIVEIIEHINPTKGDNAWKFSGQDVVRQIQLFIQGQNEVEDDFKIIKFLIKNFIAPKVNIVLIDEAIKEFGGGITGNDLQKGIYKLRLLGLISNWSVEFFQSYTLSFQEISEEEIQENIINYVLKYDTSKKQKELKKEISEIKGESLLDKCIWYLLEWTWNNIVYNRKESLATLVEWCANYNDDEFKRKVESYFRFSDLSFTLQHIAENPYKYKEWQAIFTRREYDQAKNEKEFDIMQIYSLKEWFKIQNKDVDIDFEVEQINQFKDMKASLRRFIETYQNNVGLSLLDGIIGLLSKEYSEREKQNLTFALNGIFKSSKFDEEKKNEIYKWLIEIGTIKNQEEYIIEEDLRFEFAEILGAYFPNEIESIAIKFDTPYLLLPVFNEKIIQLKKINHNLYEQVRAI